jgi:hypothetical protein
VVQGYLQGIPSHKEKEKRALLQGCESLVGTQKIQLDMKYERKSLRKCRSLKNMETIS